MSQNNSNNQTQSLIPDKSKERYEDQYKKFVEWCKIGQIMSNEVSDDVMLMYLVEQSKVMKSSTLWSRFSMIKSTLKIKENIDASKFYKCLDFLKRSSVGYEPKKSNVLTAEQISQFMNEAPDDKWLLTKVILAFGTFGACSRDELLRLTVDNVKDNGDYLMVFVRNKKTHKMRSFVISDDECPYEPCSLFRKYMALRPPRMSSKRLFVSYRDGKCLAQNVGVHTIGGVPKMVAIYLKLENPTSYTGHSFRRSTTTMLVEGRSDLSTLKRRVGWKAATETEGYDDNEESPSARKYKMSHRLLRNVCCTITNDKEESTGSGNYDNEHQSSTEDEMYYSDEERVSKNSQLPEVGETHSQQPFHIQNNSPNKGDKGFSKPQMDALQFNPQLKTITIVKTELPAIVERNDVIVKVAYAGICGTDLHIIDGTFPCRDRPVILGHEFCGVASSIGADVKHIKRGDRVVVDPNSGCGTCQYCTRGQYHMCTTGGINSTVGIWSNGGWAQFCKVSAHQVYRIPDGITFQQAVLTEPLSCVCHGWERLAPLPIGASVLVTGAGIIGNLWSCLLHHTGHRNVTVQEPVAARRALVQQLDTGFKVCSPEEIEAQRMASPQFGVDVCIDCSGSGPAIQRSLSLLHHGGKLCIFGVASPESIVCLSPYEVYLKELTIIGVLINHFTFSKAINLIEAMKSRYLDYEKLGIKVYPLDKYQDAFLALKKGTISKAVFKLSSGPD